MGDDSFSGSPKVIERKAVALTRQKQDKQQKGESGNHVSVELVERLLQKMSERHDHQHAPECYEGLSDAEAENQERSREQFNKGDDRSGGPQRPVGQEALAVGIDKELPRVLDRTELEDLPHSRHEED